MRFCQQIEIFIFFILRRFSCLQTVYKLKIEHDHHQNVPFGGIKSSPVPKLLRKYSINHIENMHLRYTNKI